MKIEKAGEVGVRKKMRRHVIPTKRPVASTNLQWAKIPRTQLSFLLSCSSSITSTASDGRSAEKSFRVRAEALRSAATDKVRFAVARSNTRAVVIHRVLMVVIAVIKFCY